MRTATEMIVLVLAGVMTACGSSSPTPASPAAPAVVMPVTPASVASISPTIGSTGGATEVRITGTGLGARVTFGGATVTGRLDSRYPGSFVLAYTPVHAEGTVDVVVSGAAGEPVTVAGGFTYVSPRTFDFNGRWSGYGNNGQDTPIRFTIENGMLLEVSCLSISSEPDAVVRFSPPQPVTDNEFSYAAGAVVFSGRMATPVNATGTIRLGACESDAWYAAKQP